MNRLLAIACGFVLLLPFAMSCCTCAIAQPLFSDDFEAGLSQWTGKNNGLHHGTIVDDPLRTGNHVLTFTSLNGAGDIFTTQQFNLNSGQEYALSFEYLGLPKADSVANDLGGAFGMSEDLPGRHVWFFGTSPTEPPVPDNLVDDGQWRTYSLVLTAPLQFVFYGGGTGNGVHLMTEDYDGNGVPGDVYYDNIRFGLVATTIGDYNGNGIVDAADYSTWRDGLGTIYTQADYAVWKSHFGTHAGSGSFADPAAIPEPSMTVLLIAAIIFAMPVLAKTNTTVPNHFTTIRRFR